MESTQGPHSLKGGCQCGQVRYELTGPPREIYVCHCRECQKQSASAFGISVNARSADVQLLAGKLNRWTRSTDAGNALACYFCPDCGTHVWHGDKELEVVISLKGGSLDEPVDLTEAIHIWTDRRLKGVVIPEGNRQVPGEPDD